MRKGTDTAQPKYPVRQLVYLAADILGIEPEALQGKRKFTRLAHARFAIALVASEAGWSCKHIGRHLGGRDHSTICHAIERSRDLYNSDEFFRALVNALRDKAGLAFSALVFRKEKPANVAKVEAKLTDELTANRKKKNALSPDDHDAKRRKKASQLFMIALRRAHPERFAA